MVEQAGEKGRKDSTEINNPDEPKAEPITNFGGDEALKNHGRIEKLINEKLAEQRSLETLLRIQFSDLKDHFKQSVRRWGFGLSLFLAILGIIGYPTIVNFIKSQVGSQLQSKLITPEVDKTVRKAIEDQSKNFVNAKINPLNTKIAEMKNDLDKLESLAKSINSISVSVEQLKGKLNAAENDLKELSDEAAILGLSYDVRQGERSTFNKIVNVASHPSTRKGALAKSILDDLKVYFNDYKYQLVHQQVINTRTKKYVRLPAEELHDIIYNSKNAYMREAGVNDIGDRKFKYLVEDLVKVTGNDTNLKVACRAVRALEELTGERFRDGPPFTDVEVWWKKTGHNNKEFMNPLKHLDDADRLLAQKEFDKAVDILEEITRARKGLCLSHYKMAQIYMAKGSKEKAKEHLKIVNEECDTPIEGLMEYAGLLYQDGKKNEVIDIFYKVKPYIENQEGFEKGLRSSFKELAGEERFKKLFESK